MSRIIAELELDMNRILTAIRTTPLPWILLLALCMRLPLLSGSFWLDEAAQALESARPLSEQSNIAADFQPPLLHYIVHFMLYISHAEAWLRMVSVVSGIVTIWGIYVLTLRSVSKKAAIAAGLLLATAAFHIFFSQELRPYALATMFATWSWYALLYTKPSGKFLHPSYLLLTLGGLFSMYMYPFIIVSQALYIFVHQKPSRRDFLWSIGAVGVLSAFWLPKFLEQLAVGTQLAKDLPGWSVVVAVPQLKVLPLTLAKFFLGTVELNGSVPLILMSGIPVLIALVLLWKSAKNKKTIFFVYWFIIPLIGAWLLSFVVPVIAPKRLLVILPALFAAMAVGLFAKLQRQEKWAIVILATLIGWNVFMWGLYLVTPTYQRENWRDLVYTIEQEDQQVPSRVVFAFPEAFAPWRWYASSTLPVTVTGTIRVTNQPDIDARFSSEIVESQVFVFDYLQDLTDPQRQSLTWFREHGWTERRMIDGGDIGWVRVLTKDQ